LPASFKNVRCGYPTNVMVCIRTLTAGKVAKAMSTLESIAIEKTGKMRKLTSIGTLTILAMLSSCSALPTAYELKLAEHLTATGAKMYGAYWCPHCGAQKAYFSGVADQLPYVECDAQGLNAQPDLCAQMGIEVYPTWIIEGNYYTGVQLPGKLAALSGFEADGPSPDWSESTNLEEAVPEETVLEESSPAE
jgi:hypothetical protein